MFENVAPVSPEAALEALERVGNGDPNVAALVSRRHRLLLRSLAYDPILFERSATLLAQAATQSMDEQDIKETSNTFTSLFTLYLSGTHATIAQRLRVIERLLRSDEPKQRSLGLAALGEALKATHFSSGYSFEFGARSRDYGYQPRSNEDLAQWYGATLALIERLAFAEGMLKPEIRDLLAQNFHGMWTSARMFDALEILFCRFAAEGFWREGWMACRQTLHFDRDRLGAEGYSRLAALEAELRPTNLPEWVRAVVLSDRLGYLDLEDLEDIDLDGDTISRFERLEMIAREFGAAVALDEEVFTELVLDLLRGGRMVWAFGRGLVSASESRRATWTKLVEGLAQIPPEQRNVQVLCGYLAELWEQNRDLAQDLLDEALDLPALVVLIPVLHSAVQLDVRCVDRLKRALVSGQVPVWMYRNLAWGRTTDQLAGSELGDFLLLIAEQSDGFNVALEILSMRLFTDRSEQREHDPKLLQAGREILRHVRFGKHNHRDEHNLACVVRACLIGPDADRVAAEVAARLRQAVGAYETYAFDNDDLLAALLSVQPISVLDALFEGGEREQRTGIQMFDYSPESRSNPADVISCQELIAWCNCNRETRYPLAASFVSFARRTEKSGPKVWSEQARALLAHAPDPKSVLTVFVNRFRPMSWSGSRAALMESNARLLDCLEMEILENLMPFVVEAKDQLVREIARARQSETEEDRARDERFE